MHRRLGADFVDDGPRGVERKVPERGTAAFDLQAVQPGGVRRRGSDALATSDSLRPLTTPSVIRSIAATRLSASRAASVSTASAGVGASSASVPS
jgi:hypothetical protein